MSAPGAAGTLPNLPGYRPSKATQPSNPKKSVFRWVQGAPLCLDDGDVGPKNFTAGEPLDAPANELSADGLAPRYGAGLGGSVPATPTVPHFVTADRQVLRFYGYFKEGVVERVRRGARSPSRRGARACPHPHPPTPHHTHTTHHHTHTHTHLAAPADPRSRHACAPDAVCSPAAARSRRTSACASASSTTT